MSANPGQRAGRDAAPTEALGRGAKRVYASARQPLAHPDERVTPLTLDVTSAAQVQAAAEAARSLDILFERPPPVKQTASS